MFSYKLLVCLLFISLVGIIAEGMRFLPSWDVSIVFSAEPWKTLYGTHIFDCGKFFIFLLTIIFGFTYVNMVSLAGKRKHPFHSRDGTKRDFLLVCLLSPLLYLLGAQISIKGINDVLTFSECTEDSDSLNHPALFYIFHTHSCPSQQRSLTHREIAFYNLIYYIIPFFLGINFTHLNFGRLANIKLSTHYIKRWQLLEWIFFATGLCTFLTILVYHLSVYHLMGRLTYYLAIACIPVPLVLLVGKIWIRSFYVHIHHSNLFMLFYALVGIQRPFPSFIQALCLGGMIEGIAHWGLELPIGRRAGGRTGKKKIIHLDDGGMETHQEEKIYHVPICSQSKYI